MVMFLLLLCLHLVNLYGLYFKFPFNGHITSKFKLINIFKRYEKTVRIANNFCLKYSFVFQEFGNFAFKANCGFIHWCSCCSYPL